MTNARYASRLLSLAASACAFTAAFALFASVFIASAVLLAAVVASTLGALLCLRAKHAVRDERPRLPPRAKPVLAPVR